jgi:hypothetical protein
MTNFIDNIREGRDDVLHDGAIKDKDENNPIEAEV